MAEETRILAKERDIAAIVIITVIPCGLKLLYENNNSEKDVKSKIKESIAEKIVDVA